MWSLQSSHPDFLRTLTLVYILMATRRVATGKHTACVTISHEALDGGLMKLEVNLGGAGIAEKFPLSHHGSSYRSSRGIRIMLAARMLSSYQSSECRTWRNFKQKTVREEARCQDF